MDLRTNQDFLFRLTKSQMREIKHLFRAAEEAFDDGQKGMIVLQPWSDGYVTGGFVPQEMSLKLIDACKDIDKSEGKK